MKIFGYSERGVINSLMYNIGEDKKLLFDFIKLINIPEKLNIGEPDYCEILIEQSLSQFGESDLIIILHYKDPVDKIVLFFEAKVKTSQGKWIIKSQYEKFKDHKEGDERDTSNLFFQLYLKSLLIKNFTKIEEGIKDIDRKTRKIGKNDVVLKAKKKIKGFKKAYYIAIVPTLTKDLVNFLNTNKLKLEYDINFLTWKTIYEFCKNKKIKKVLDVFDFNETQIY